MQFEESKIYTIFSNANRLAVEVENASMENGALVKLSKYTGGAHQQWQVRYVDGQWFKLINCKSGKLLDTVASGTEQGTWLQQWQDADTPDQLWCADDGIEGHVFLKSKKSGRCMDIVAMFAVEGALLQLWDAVNGENQQWCVEAVTDEKPKAKRETKSTKAAPKTAKKADPQAPKAEKTTKAKTTRAAKAAKPAETPAAEEAPITKQSTPKTDAQKAAEMAAEKAATEKIVKTAAKAAPKKRGKK